MAYQVKIVEGGKIALPAALRRKHGYVVGQRLLVEDGADGLSIRSADDVIRRAQDWVSRLAPGDRCLSDELIADRRREAAGE